ncbi:transcription factor bHLH120-like [Solanum dulcamara]|uniref:transcription factor bHLH120-like n=1 Tax=Solanum dulcamara TaxID=45834 RepID=UPI0024851865|nr:transcription factor bHLH120-like [Solanum dulcamara]
MFSLQGNDDLLLQILSNSCQQSKISQDPVMDSYVSMETTRTHIPPNINSQKKRLPKRKIGTTNNDDQTAVSDDHFKLRRIIHRDIERQRRQEMSVLYSSLRSLLPLQYVKGKRSVSDHMHEAVNYIKETQGNIKELEERRDLLSKSSPLPNSIRHGTENGSKNSRFTDCTVTVSPCLQGFLQISISVDCKGKIFPLSRILGELLKQGLNVVNCVSAKVDQRSLYTIQTEACDMNNIDHLTLQQKVIDMINLDL